MVNTRPPRIFLMRRRGQEEGRGGGRGRCRRTSPVVREPDEDLEQDSLEDRHRLRVRIVCAFINRYLAEYDFLFTTPSRCGS